MKFTKMHGLGNDFIIMDYIDSPMPKNQSWEELAKKVCRRGFSVGADGLVLLTGNEDLSYNMRIFNSDGSEAQMCGNAIRCIGKYLYEDKNIKQDKLIIETKGGTKKLTLKSKDDKVEEVEVNMEKPILESKDIPVKGDNRKIIGETVETPWGQFEFTAVSMGNPHIVIFNQDLEDDETINQVGSYLEKHDLFPEGTNVEFVQIKDSKEMNVKVWERGAGRTYACGTGACASLVASVLNGYTDLSAKVNLPGGSLNISWDKDNSGDIFMSGKAEIVYRGELS